MTAEPRHKAAAARYSMTVDAVITGEREELFTVADDGTILVCASPKKRARWVSAASQVSCGTAKG